MHGLAWVAAGMPSHRHAPGQHFSGGQSKNTSAPVNESTPESDGAGGCRPRRIIQNRLRSGCMSRTRSSECVVYSDSNPNAREMYIAIWSLVTSDVGR